MGRPGSKLAEYQVQAGCHDPVRIGIPSVVTYHRSRFSLPDSSRLRSLRRRSAVRDSTLSQPDRRSEAGVHQRRYHRRTHRSDGRDHRDAPTAPCGTAASTRSTDLTGATAARSIDAGAATERCFVQSTSESYLRFGLRRAGARLRARAARTRQSEPTGAAPLRSSLSARVESRAESCTG